MTMRGSKPASAIRASEPSGTFSNYFQGNDPDKWLANVRHFGRITYEGVYPGIDAVYYGNQRQLEYDFVVAPGADPKRIRLAFDGADRMTLDKNGDLLLYSGNEAVRQMKPFVYQEIDGVRQQVSARYQLKGREIAFALGSYDRSKKLIIDPVLVYSSFLGGTGVENGSAITVDAAGNVYVAGSTSSADFPVPSGLPGQATVYRGGPYDAFVAKYTVSGFLQFSTFIGGSGSEAATGVGVDTSGAILVGGETDSPNFPMRNALQPVIGGEVDAFLLKMNAAGALVYSTYLGGFETEHAHDLVVDGANNVILVGVTESTNFWSSGGLQPAYLGGATDGWVFKMDPDGMRVWSTYVGGGANDRVNGVAVDTQNNVYITGATSSLGVSFVPGQGGPSGFPVTAGAFQLTLRAVGQMDAFVTKIRADGGQYMYSTYLGGTNYDEATAIAVNAGGNAFVTGNTSSSNFPTVNTLQGPPGNQDVFVTRLNTTGTALDFSTYLAGSGVDSAADIALDPNGNPYILGTTTSHNFPVVNPMQPSLSASQDVFIARLAADGSARQFATYFGGTSDDVAGGIAVDATSTVYITGSTTSVDFPRAGNTNVYSGTQDAFVSKIASCDITLLPSGATFGPAAANGSFNVAATNCPWSALPSDTWITVTSAATGINNGIITYTLAGNAGTARTGFISVGGVRYTITQGGLTSMAPSVVSLVPNAGSGNAQTFTARYNTANPGGGTIDRTYLLINTTVTGQGGCLVEYSPATATFRMISDNGSTWSNPALAGTATTLSNSQCSLNVGASSGSVFAGTGTTETQVFYALTFQPAFAGNKNSYLLAASESSGLNSGWVQGGTYTVTTSGGGTGGTVGVVSITPQNGSGNAGTFTGVFSHTGGVNQLSLGYMLFLPTPNVVQFTAQGSCLIEFNNTSSGIRLINDAGTGWIGPIEGVPIGSVIQPVLSNSYCTVNVQSATAFRSGNTLSVTVPVTFTNSLGPVLGTFLQAQDIRSVWSGMTQMGNWVIPGAPPVRTGPAIFSIQPATAAGSSATYTITSSSPTGGAGLGTINLLISDRIVGGTPCHVIYFPDTNIINLVNDAGNGFVSTGITPGLFGFLSNSRCQVNTAGASVSAVGTNLSVTVPLSFNAQTFGGFKGVWGNAFDRGSANQLTTHWVQGGTLTVQ
jgi:hypothetical protein